MWLITTLIAAIAATLARYLLKGKYKLGLLSLMLWGAVIIILTDFILGYEGGPLIEMETDGLIPNATWLGLIMLVPVLLIWLIANFKSKFNN